MTTFSTDRPVLGFSTDAPALAMFCRQLEKYPPTGNIAKFARDAVPGCSGKRFLDFKRSIFSLLNTTPEPVGFWP